MVQASKAAAAHTAPTALLDLPSCPGRAVLRAALMALRVPPVPLPAEAEARRQSLAGLASQSSTVAFIDISHAQGSRASGLADLFAQAPSGPARRRIMLTRLGAGHVSEADRQWVHELGFADLLPELELQDAAGTLRRAVDWAAQETGLATLPPAELGRFVRAAVQPATQASTQSAARSAAQSATDSDARALIRRRTGLAAEAFASRLGAALDIRDRRWHLQTYPRCFVGSEAVQRITSAWPCSAAEAVELGQALGRLGLLVHVVHEHAFLDQPLFYRLAWTDGLPAPTLGTLWQSLSLPGGVEAITRRYLGKAYPDCWVGRHAVDHLSAQHGLDRLDAWLALHRMMQFGLFEHVTRARPFIDGDFFYRFAPTGH